MNRPGEAIVHYQRAAELQTQTPIEALLSMGEMATCKILTREFSLSIYIRYVASLGFVCVYDLTFDFFLQVTTMVLCQCSQRCSWCARREDCSYQAPARLLVRFCFYQKPAKNNFETLNVICTKQKKCRHKDFDLMLRSKARCLNKIKNKTGWDYSGVSFLLLCFWSCLLCPNFPEKGAFLDIVAKCEISRVLLLMLLEVNMILWWKILQEKKITTAYLSKFNKFCVFHFYIISISIFERAL